MMRWLARLWDRRKADLSEELEAHLRLAIEDRVRVGEDPSAARRSAIRELGNIPLIEEVAREHRGLVWLENAVRDVRFALRQLRRSPGFVVTVLLTLALGIGANLAVFQLLHSVLLARLPVSHPEELVAVHAARTPFDRAWIVSYGAYHRLRTATGSQAPLLARAPVSEAVMQLPNQGLSHARYEFVSDNYFEVLGVRPAAGRLFIQDDAHAGQSEWPAVLRYDFARDFFGSPNQALGKRVLLNGVPAVVVGVAGQSFLGTVIGFAPDFWLPLEAQSSGHLGTAFDSLGPGHGVNLKSSWLNQDTIFWLSLIGRVPADRRDRIASQWSSVFKSDRILMTTATVDPAAKAEVLGGHVELVDASHGISGIRQESSRPLTLLMALSISVFLVGCLNLANLQIARLSAREQELGIRAALGASRWRLLRQVMIEDGILVVIGGLAAFFVGHAASNALVHWASSRDWLLSLDFHLNAPIAVLGVGLMAAAFVAFSILPALRFMRKSLSGAAGSRAKISGISQTRFQRWRSNATLAAQVSLSLLLATMASCFAATLVHWERLDIGMDREHILSVYLDMGRTGYASHQTDLPWLYRRLTERLDAVDGVRSSAVEMCPLPDCGWNTALYVFGRSGLSNAQVHGKEDHVGPGYFTTMGIPLLRGRDFSLHDNDSSQGVTIVSRSYARQLFGDENPIGHWVGYEPAPNDHKFLIVGEVADARVDGARFEPPPVAYMSIDQRPAPVHTIQVRATGAPRAVAQRVRQALLQIDPALPITETITLDDEFNDALGNEKLLTRLAAIYAALTLLLVAIGFYGVVSFRTARRKSEFGIRLALGATRENIQLLIVGQTARILAAGIIPGLLLSAVAVRLSRGILFGSTASDALAATSATLVLLLAGLIAALIPARRAASADPLETLRQE